VPPALLAGLGIEPSEVHVTEANYFAVYRTEEEVWRVKPQLALLETLHPRGVCITAVGSEADIVSRYFAPGYGIPEDPVTGSTHCTLVPLWSRRLGKSHLHARQVSERGGDLFCEERDGRVLMAGDAALFLVGTIYP
jgi:predicted PhzF superfamily epimerase YddE/YHI9